MSEEELKSQEINKEKLMSPVEHQDWEKAFRMIELENNLANHRFTALLTVQGLLFAAFVGGVKVLLHLVNASSPKSPLNHISVILCVLVIVCLVGIASAYHVFFGLEAAYRQVQKSAEWLANIQKCEDGYKKNCPYLPITGKARTEEYDVKYKFDEEPYINSLEVGMIQVPFLLRSVWVVFLLLVDFWGVVILCNYGGAIRSYLGNCRLRHCVLSHILCGKGNVTSSRRTKSGKRDCCQLTL